jgi:SAM-dependent methyltransferase
MTDRSLPKELHEENRLSWNEATKAHNSHKGDQAKFLREGGTTLFPEEIELLGDIQGLSLLHLQCNAGQDTLSLAKLGAVVTGVDISDEAIAFAQKLAQDTGIPATFYRDDIYDWFVSHRDPQFDVVFSSYGAILWLSNLQEWAKGIATVLKPGGRFVLIDFHPVALMFNFNFKLEAPYFNTKEPLTWEDGVSDYVAESGDGLALGEYQPGIENFCNPYRVHEFQWGIGEIVTALLNVGLRLTTLREYPYSNGCKLYENMLQIDGRRMVLPEEIPNLPLMYAIVTQKL